MDIDIAVIPVAGLGTRLLPATKSQPKEMLPVGRKPVVQYVVEELTRVGMKRVLFITGPGKASIENHFDLNGELIQTLRESGKEELLAELEYERATVQYFYTRQRQLLGLGHAVSCARSFVGNQPFVVALGDSIIGMNAESDVVQRMTRCYRQKQRRGRDRLRRRSAQRSEPVRDRPAQNERRALRDRRSRRKTDAAPKRPAIWRSPHATSCRRSSSTRWQDTQRGKGGEIQLTDAIRTVIRNGGKAYGVRLRPGERRYDIGNFEAYFEAFVEFALADPKFGPALRRRLLDVLRCFSLVNARSHARACSATRPTATTARPSRSASVTTGPRSCSTSGNTVEIVLADDDRARFDSVHELARDVRLHGYYGGIRLIKATIKRFVEHCQTRKLTLHDRKFSVRYQTTIPRQVGLAGSSAIIVATLRCLMEFYEVQLPLEAQPMFVLLVEQEELGITVGLQDRVIQVYEGLVYMDFDRAPRAHRRRPSLLRVRTDGPGASSAAVRRTPRDARASRPRCFTTTSASASIEASRTSLAR